MMHNILILETVRSLILIINLSMKGSTNEKRVTTVYIIQTNLCKWYYIATMNRKRKLNHKKAWLLFSTNTQSLVGTIFRKVRRISHNMRVCFWLLFYTGGSFWLGFIWFFSSWTIMICNIVADLNTFKRSRFLKFIPRNKFRFSVIGSKWTWAWKSAEYHEHCEDVA